MARSTLIGFFIGVLPGSSGAVAAFLAYDVMPASGLAGLPNLPQEVVSKWEDVVTEGLKNKTFVSALEKTGTIPAYQSSKQYRDWTEQQYKIAKDLAEKLKLRK